MASSPVDAGRSSPDYNRPNMSDLRIVLIGKNESENNRVENFIKSGAAAVSDSGASSHVQQLKKRIGGQERNIRVFNFLLLQPHVTDQQVIQAVKVCVSECAPGPLVFILVLQYNDFSDQDKHKVKDILSLFSQKAIEHTIVLTTDEETRTSKITSYLMNSAVHNLIKECGGRHVQLDERNSSWYYELLRCTEMILKEKDEEFVICDVYGDGGDGTAVDEDLDRDSAREEHRDSEKHNKRSRHREESEKLNLVLCGNERSKSSISELFLRESWRGSVVCSQIKSEDVDLHGRQISLMEFPALINLSEEEVMRQTLHCVSLCHPGVHLFILLIPDGPLSNEDKAEVEKMQKIFSSRLNKHMMILIQQDSELHTAELSEETQTVIQSLEGRLHFISRNTPVSKLMEKIEQMLEENRGEVFSTETFLELQMEKLKEYDEMKRRIHSLEMWFQSQGSNQRANDLRIVLLGKTGVGKSATGNTILGREAFISDICVSSLTKKCEKETAEINGRQVTVIDTPGLFDTQLSNEETKREISNCISMILPGPHVFLLLISLGRFTQEEQESVKIIQEHFGENSLKYTIVLFTRGDDLKNKTLDHFLQKANSALKNLIETCGNRVHVFNNNQTEDRTQVSDLLMKIENMVEANGGSNYSCKMFREMERGIQEKQMMIMEEKVEQLKREREELMRKHEDDDKRMKRMMLDERQLLNEERKRIEREFEEREERHKKDIKEMEGKEAKMQEEMKREREQRDKEDERRRKKEQEMMDEHKNEIERIQQNYDKERKRRDEDDERRRKMDKETWDEYFEKFKRDRQKILQEKEELKLKHEAEKNKMKRKKEEDRQKRDNERKRREEEFREEQYKRDIKDIEDHEKEVEEMKREREEWYRQKEQDRQRETDNYDQTTESTPEDQHTKNEGASASEPECLRILLFGRTGSGKSATGNTILGKQQFCSEESKDPVTTVCQKAVGEAEGRSVSVVDTPGLFDLTLSKEQVEEQILKCVSLSAPGPHVFIIVVNLGKNNQEVRDTLDMITMMFGPEAAKFCIVLFTKADTLKNQTITQYVEQSKNDELRNLISACGDRFLAFNNTKTQDRTQVTELFKMIEELRKSNQGRYFTNEVFQEAEVSIDRRMETLEEIIRRNQTQVKELSAKYEMEISNRRRRLEDKKRKTEEEQMRLENKFIIRAERLRREFEEKEKSDLEKQEEEAQKQADLEKQMTEEYNQRIEEIEDQRKLYEKQQDEREEEYRKQEEEYKQNEEKMKNIELLIKEEEMKKGQEEKEREVGRGKVKEAERDQQGIMEQLKEKKKELEKLKKKSERDKENRQVIEEERERQRQEKDEEERKYEEMRDEIKRQYEQQQEKRKEEWKRRKQEDEERREEKRRRWRNMIDDLEEQGVEIKRRGREERERIKQEEQKCDEMKQNQDDKIEKMKKKHQDEATKEQEELKAFTQRVDQQVQKLKDMITLIYAEESAKREKWSCHVM